MFRGKRQDEYVLVLGCWSVRWLKINHFSMEVFLVAPLQFFIQIRHGHTPFWPSLSALPFLPYNAAPNLVLFLLRNNLFCFSCHLRILGSWQIFCGVLCCCGMICIDVLVFWIILVVSFFVNPWLFSKVCLTKFLLGVPLPLPWFCRVLATIIFLKSRISHLRVLWRIRYLSYHLDW